MRSALRATGDEEAEDNDRELADEIADDDKNQGRGRGRGRSRGKGRGRGRARDKARGGKQQGRNQLRMQRVRKKTRLRGVGLNRLMLMMMWQVGVLLNQERHSRKKNREKLRLRPSGRSGCRPGKKAPKQRVSNQSPSAVGFCCFYLFFLPSTAASTMADLRLHVRGERKAP